MQESAQAALTYTRSQAHNLGIDPEVFEKADIHIHLPEGAVPKDGPSAGVTLAVALISAFTNRPVRREVSMTGEITLRGRVLPVGGIREKALAARRAGITTFIMPRKNESDLQEIPKKLRQDLTFVLVDSVDEVLQAVLGEPLAEDTVEEIRSRPLLRPGNQRNATIMTPIATFSIVAYDPGRQEWGVAVQSKFLAVGAVVPWARAGAGVVATQAHANLRYGPDGLEMMGNGRSAPDTLAALIAADDGRAQRQVGLVDQHGVAAAHTGAACNAWAGHIIGAGFACQGNILLPGTVEAMAASFDGPAPGARRIGRLAGRRPGRRAGGRRRQPWTPGSGRAGRARGRRLWREQ